MKRRYMVLALGLSFSILTGCSTSVPKQELEKQEAVQEEVIEDTKNIVAVTVAATQVMDRMGLDLVGVPTTKQILPTRYEGVTQIGQVTSPDFEVISSLEPDLVVIDSMFQESMEQGLSEFGMEAFYFDTSTYTKFLQSIKEIGNVLGKEEEALNLVEELKEVEQVVQSKQEGEVPTVAILFGGSENFMLATDQSYIGDLVQVAGAHNITDDLKVASDYIPFSMEQMVASNPDYILRFAHGNLEETKKAFDEAFDKNPAFATLNAVKEGKVFDLDPTVFGVSANIHAVDAITVLGNLLYGE